MVAAIRAIETRYKGCRFRSRLEARWAVFFTALGIKWEYEPEGFDLPGGRYLPDFFLPFPAQTWLARHALCPHPCWMEIVPYSPSYRNRRAYWVEVKPEGEPSEKEKRLALDLAKQTRHHTFLFAGIPRADSVKCYVATIDGQWINNTSRWRASEKDRRRRFVQEVKSAKRTKNGEILLRNNLNDGGSEFTAHDPSEFRYIDKIVDIELDLYSFSLSILRMIRNLCSWPLTDSNSFFPPCSEVRAACLKATSARFEHGETPS